MADRKNVPEKDIADNFSALRSQLDKKEFTLSLPKNIKAAKVPGYMNKLSDKVEFIRYYFGKNKTLNKYVREFNSKKNILAKKLINSKANYKISKFFFLPLRTSGESLLIREALETAIKKNRKHRDFLKSISIAEEIASFVREQAESKSSLDQMISEKIKGTGVNRLVIDNLTDIFEHDPALLYLKNDLNEFVISRIERKRAINEVIADAEKRIIDGDIKNVYNEIEKTEELIANNMGQALVDVFNAIQVMATKKAFVAFAEDKEVKYFSREDIDLLSGKANEYRNMVLPKKWEEMRFKCNATEKVEHFAAWSHGLKEGRYSGVVSNVKEYIVKILIKKILTGLIEKHSEMDTEGVNVITLLESKKKDYEETKDALKKLLNTDTVKKSDDPLIPELKDLAGYYFALNDELLKEKSIIEKTLDEIAGLDTIRKKLEHIKALKIILPKNVKEKSLALTIGRTYEKLLKLYELAESREKKEETKTATAGKDKPGLAIDFLNDLHKELFNSREIKDIAGKVASIPEETVIDVLAILKLDPRFEKYFPEIEEALYRKDWGRTIGLIVIKTKEIEKNLGMKASEQYLDDLAKRLSMKLGESSFIVKKIRNMKTGLLRIHEDGAKKLHYLRERLARAKSTAEKMIELRKLSADPAFAGVFGTIQNLERIFVRDDFDGIYSRIKKLPVHVQKALLEGIQDDLISLLKYEPETVGKLVRHTEELNKKIEMYPELLPKKNESLADSLVKFEKNELPLIDLEEMMEIGRPDNAKYSENNVSSSMASIGKKIESGKLPAGDINIMIDAIATDISLLKIEGGKEALGTLDNAKNLLAGLTAGLEISHKIDDIKNTKDYKKAVSRIFEENGANLSGNIELMQSIFREKDLDLSEKAKGFEIAAKSTKDERAKTELMEIVEVIRRIEKEIFPLVAVESKLKKLKEWQDVDYADRELIRSFLKNEMQEILGMKTREGGLLRKLFDGLEKAGNKIKYLNERLSDLEFRHLKPVVRTLIDNYSEENKIREEDIDEELIRKYVDGKDPDQKINWLKTRKYWKKYEKVSGIIDDEMQKALKFEKKEKPFASEKAPEKAGGKDTAYSDIIDITKALLEIEGSTARQNFIKKQEVEKKNKSESMKAQLKLIFYLISGEGDEPKEMLKALSGRMTLSITDKQKYLKLLKEAAVPEKGSLKGLLGMNDRDIAYYAAYVISSDKPADVRIKHLERMKGSDEKNIVEYKEYFGIDDALINDVMTELRSKGPKADKKVNPENEEILKAGLEKTSEAREKEEFAGTEETDLMMQLEEPEQATSIDVEKDNTKRTKERAISDDNVFTQEELDKIEASKKESLKSTAEIIKEQELRIEYEKRDKISKHIEAVGGRKNIEIVRKINEKAKEIQQNRSQKIESKITEILDFLATCFPEAVSKIISEEILPVFHVEKVDLDVHRVLDGLNNAVFKPALKGLPVADGLTYYEKELDRDNFRSVLKIVGNIIELWQKEIKGFTGQEGAQKKTYEEIEKGSGIGSVLNFLNRIYPENILNELKDNLILNIKNEQIKSTCQFLFSELKSAFEKGTITDGEKRMFIKSFKLNENDIKNFEEIAKKIIEISDSPNKPVVSSQKEMQKTEIPVKGQESASDFVYGGKADKDKTERFMEYALINLKTFTKPHSHLLDTARETGEVPESELTVDKRKEAIQKLYDEGKIFTYNDSTYIGKGQIANIVKANQIPKDEMGIFATRLDRFVVRFKDVKDKYDFLGVADELEMRKLNNMLDKFNINRSSGPKGYKKNIEEIIDKTSMKKGGIERKENDIESHDAYADEDMSGKGTKEKRREDREVEADNYRKRPERPITPEKKKDEVDSQFRKKREKFINETQRQVLNEAEKEINKKLEKMIKACRSKKELEEIYSSYIDTARAGKKNLINLLYDMKNLAKILTSDEELRERLAFDRNKIEKLYNSMIKKAK